MMKTLDEYMSMSYRMEIVEDKDEGGYVVSFPDLPGCITCGETIESAVANTAEAKRSRKRKTHNLKKRNYEEKPGLCCLYEFD